MLGPVSVAPVDKLFNAYRVLAYVVGVLLVVGALSSVAKYLLTEGSGLQQLGEDLTWVWLVHGWIYMVYVVVAFLLFRREQWTPRFALLMLVAGLIPVLIFWVEKQVEHKVTGTRTA